MITGYVSLPVGTVEEGETGETLDKHPPRVGAQSDGDTRRQSHKHYDRQFLNE